MRVIFESGSGMGIFEIELPVEIEEGSIKINTCSSNGRWMIRKGLAGRSEEVRERIEDFRIWRYHFHAPPREGLELLKDIIDKTEKE